MWLCVYMSNALIKHHPPRSKTFPHPPPKIKVKGFPNAKILKGLSIQGIYFINSSLADVLIELHHTGKILNVLCLLFFCEAVFIYNMLIIR